LPGHIGEFDVKETAIRNACSLIIFTNALPIAIPNRVRNKELIRSKVDTDIMKAHLSWIFDIDLMARARCVIVSGLESESFRTARRLIAQNSRNRSMLFLDLPYLGSGKPREYIESGISPSERQILKDVLCEFGSSVEIRVCS